MTGSVKTIFKQLGQTPLEAITEFKKNNPQYKNIKIGYAGRLDPMAEGLLLLTIDEACKNKHTYENFTKIYEFEVIFGIKTDSYDLLGLGSVMDITKSDISMIKSKIYSITSHFSGIIEQKYPPYSSKTLNGKPLYYLTRNNLIDINNIPKHKTEIFKFEIINNYIESNILSKIINKINLVKGDFRQNLIIKNYQKILNDTDKFLIYKFKIKVSSGTYIRQLVNDIGEYLNIYTTTYSIKRTAIGDYTIK